MFHNSRFHSAVGLSCLLCDIFNSSSQPFSEEELPIMKVPAGIYTNSIFGSFIEESLVLVNLTVFNSFLLN
jgi:hypothetical protein